MAKQNSEQVEEGAEVEDFIASMLTQAVVERASDVHLEPYASAIRIRFRIDGILQDRGTLPPEEMERILIKTKVMSNLDISRQAIPQDGHFQFVIQLPEEAYKKKEEKKESVLADATSRLFSKSALEKIKEKEKISSERLEAIVSDIGMRPLDIRVSIFPTISGEAIVLRILNRQDMFIPLKDLGMTEDVFSTIKKMITMPYGMVLVTGPAGAGKSTTLYAILQELKSDAKNIITLEDPVELFINGLRQVQVNMAQGFGFAEGIRSILRQDPDTMMIGEIRDSETAENAIRSSLAGKIVFSTIHANTVIGTVARLTDMNVERSLIAYAINGVISQRLVRKVCHNCKVVYSPTQEYLRYFGLENTPSRFVKGKGCKECGDTGFKGRTGVFEVFEFDNGLRSLIIEKAPMYALEEYVIKAGMKTLKQDAVEKILAGITTAEEASRVV